MGKVDQEYRCSLQLAICVLGGKWKMRILWYLLEGPQRFTDFMRRMPDISQKALTEQLRELEAADIISRRCYAEVPPRVEYTMTKYGMGLADVLKGMSEWAHQYAIEKDNYVATRGAKTPPEEEA